MSLGTFKGVIDKVCLEIIHLMYTIRLYFDDVCMKRICQLNNSSMFDIL